MASISLNRVSKSYAPGNVAVENLDLDIDDGELMVLVGPSGCGKSTTLRMLAGLEELTEGTITVGGQTVNNLPPQRRDVAMVFQNYALYPHMSVEENLGFGLRMRKVNKADIRRRVADVAEILGLIEYLDRKPVALSGGQRQRVAMGRAMVREPRAFLMDEPLSNLDAKLRVDMRAELAQLHERLRVTTVYVTHDQTEAMTLGDRIAVLDKGRLQQAGAPQDLYDNPANVFVAGFLGSPAMNMVTAELVSDDGLSLMMGSTRVRLSQQLVNERGLAKRVGSKVIVGIRPADLFVAERDTGAGGGATLSATVEVVESLGSEVDLLFGLDDSSSSGQIVSDVTGQSGAARRGINSALWTAVVNPASVRGVHAGARLTFGFDQDSVHFFDPESGATLGSRTAAGAPAS